MKEDIEKIKKAAEQGSARAQYNLGVMYYEGKGVTQDYSKALELFNEAGMYNLSCAYYAIAVMYFKGLGVKKDHYYAIRRLYDAMKNNYKKAAKLFYFIKNIQFIDKQYIGQEKRELKMLFDLEEKHGDLFVLKPCYFEDIQISF